MEIEVLKRALWDVRGMLLNAGAHRYGCDMPESMGILINRMIDRIEQVGIDNIYPRDADSATGEQK